jgi:cyclic pyranopterin phosphate synthase
MLLDSHQRVHNYLRISLTDVCNMRCVYCMPNEEMQFAPAKHLMQTDELLHIAKLFVALGVDKIRLTGGEPLVRKDVGEIISELGKWDIKLAITTNGQLIDRYIQTCKEAGLQSINVSLDTLHAARFLALTKRDQFHQVKRNIDLLLQQNFSVKVNMVVMKGLNENEINDFVRWTYATPIHIRFIEFMPFADNRWQSSKVFTYAQMLESISEEFSFIKLEDEKNDTTKKYTCYGHAGTFAVISTMTSPFCSTCNRLRLTADGKLKNCLFSKEETDLLTPLRLGRDITPLLLQNVRSKKQALGGQLPTDFTTTDASALENRSMIKIGG